MRFEDEVRTRLHRMADSVGSPPRPGDPLVRRARGRMVRTGAALTMTVAALVFGSVAGVESLERPARPSIEPAASPSTESATGDADEPTASIDSPAATEGSRAPNAPDEPMVYAYTDSGPNGRIEVTLTLGEGTGTLEVRNETSEATDPPSIYVIREQDGKRVHVVVDGGPVPAGATAEFEVELPDGMSPDDIAKVALVGRPGGGVGAAWSADA